VANHRPNWPEDLAPSFDAAHGRSPFSLGGRLAYALKPVPVPTIQFLPPGIAPGTLAGASAPVLYFSSPSGERLREFGDTSTASGRWRTGPLPQRAECARSRQIQFRLGGTWRGGMAGAAILTGSSDARVPAIAGGRGLKPRPVSRSSARPALPQLRSDR